MNIDEMRVRITCRRFPPTKTGFKLFREIIDWRPVLRQFMAHPLAVISLAWSLSVVCGITFKMV